MFTGGQLVPTMLEVIVDSALGGEKLLRMSASFEALHVSLSSASRSA
jgi:hypothetical protein